MSTISQITGKSGPNILDEVNQVMMQGGDMMKGLLRNSQHIYVVVLCSIEISRRRRRWQGRQRRRKQIPSSVLGSRKAWYFRRDARECVSTSGALLYKFV